MLLQAFMVLKSRRTVSLAENLKSFIESRSKVSV